MTTDMNQRATIADLLAEVDAEIQLLRVRRNGLATALDTFGPAGSFTPDDEEPIELVPAVEEPDPLLEQSIPLEDDEVTIVRTAPKPKKAGPLPFKCDCGASFAKQQGLSMHKTKTHGGRNVAPPAPVAAPAAPRPTGADALVRVPASAAPDIADDALALRCDDCEFTAPVGSMQPVISHTMTSHGRVPHGTERRPRVAA